MKKRKTILEEKGVTIVALVVTIIVLLILAGISLKALSGDGLVHKATNAGDEYESASIDEELLRVRGIAMVKGNNKIKYSDLKEELDKLYGADGYEINPKEDADSWNVKIGKYNKVIEGINRDIKNLELTPDNAYKIGYSKNTLNQLDIPGEFTYEGIKYRITSLGEGLFSGDNTLRKVSVPDTVITIKDNFLANAGSLQKIYIGSGVTSIEGGSSLINTWDLNEIQISEDNQAFKSIDGVMFTKNGNSLIYYPPDKPGNSYTVPDGVKTINHSAFTVASSLKNISLPDSLKYIGYNIFCWSGIESITIPNSVSFIGGFAFADCDDLESVTLPSSLTEIKPYTFEGSRKITSMTIPENVRKIGTYAFDTYSTVNLTFENYSNINSLDDYALYSTAVSDTTARNYFLSLNSKAFSWDSGGSGSIWKHHFSEITDY